MSEATTQRMSVKCACGVKLSVPASAAGRKAKCPKCGQPFTVPQPKPPEPPVEPDDLASPEEDLLEELAAQARSAPAESRPTAAIGHPDCPQCHAPLKPDAVLCVKCGYNVETGRSTKGAQAPSKAAGAAKKVAGKVGRLALGSLCSGVGALIGGGIWFAVAVITDYQIGWIAWGVGLLAGLGMLLGMGGPDPRGGVVAALMAAVGIVSAKVMMFVFIIYVALTGDTDNIDYQRTLLAGIIAEETLVEQGALSQSQREEQWDEALADAENRVARMSDHEVRRRWTETYEEQPAFEFDDEDLQRGKLAGHHAGREADNKGLSYWDDEREKLLEEQQARFDAMSGDELAKAFKELEAWEENGKWDDPQYVRSYLIYHHIDNALSEARENSDEEVDSNGPSEEEWKAHYDAAVTRVDESEPDEQLQQARRIEREQEEEFAAMIASFENQQIDEEVGAGALGIFFTSMFGLLDIVFLLLAVGTAFKLAGSGFEAGG